LNRGNLPEGYYALAEQVLGGPIPHVVTLHRPSRLKERPGGGVAMAERPPRTRFRLAAEPDIDAARANPIVIRHSLGAVVAIIEVVSPGNKHSRHALRSFVEKSREILDQGIHLLVIDLFLPSPRDPQRIHKAIWDEIHEEPFKLPDDKPLTLAAYVGGPLKKAYVEPVAVGDALPEMPIFLSTETYVPASLESTYMATWTVCPAPVREWVEASPASGSD
jgi:hypothetical protein